MTTYPLVSPASYGIASVQWTGATNSALGQSPWTMEDIVQVFDGEKWRGVLTVASQDDAQGRALTAWLLSLRGVRGTFLLGDPAAPQALGSAAAAPGTPVVDGAGQTGSTLNLRGLPVSASGYLLAGDYIQLGAGATARLHRVLANVDSDGSGDAAIELFPAIRTAASDGAAVVVDDAQGVFRLSRNGIAWDVRGSGVRYDDLVLPIQSASP